MRVSTPVHGGETRVRGDPAAESRRRVWPFAQFKPSHLVSVAASIAVMEVLLAALGWTILSFLRQCLQTLQFPLSLEYGEGPLLDVAMRLSRFGSIYSTDYVSRSTYLLEPYPPLFVLLQVPFVWLFGPAYWYGRALSMAAVVIAAISLGLTAHALTHDRLAALISGLLLLAVPYIQYWSQLNRVDSLALGLSCLGLYVVVRWPGKGIGLAAGAALLVAAIYTRQSELLAAPSAALIWLWSRGARRQAITLALLITSAVLGLFVVLNALTGGGFFANIVLGNLGRFDVVRLTEFLNGLALTVPYLLTCGMALLVAGGQRPAGWWLGAPYLVAAALGSLTIGKIGSYVNYFFELSAALCLATGLVIAWQRNHWLRTFLLLLLALQVGWLALVSRAGYVHFLSSRVALREEIGQLAEIVRDADGPVLADEYSGLLPLAGRPVIIEPFLMKQAWEAGLWDQGPFVESIRRGEYAVILIWDDRGSRPLYRERWTDEMLQAIRDAYQSSGVIADTEVFYPARR